MQKLNILFVVTAFYPEQAIGSIRTTKFAKYLQSHGLSITVISLTPPPWASKDESLRFEGLDRMRWVSVGQSSFFKRFFEKARVSAIGSVSANSSTSVWNSSGTILKTIRNFAQLIYTLIKAIDWSICVRRYAKLHFKNDRFDFIYTSYPSIASPLSGLLLKKLGFGKNIIVDFRDPIVTADSSNFVISRLLQNAIINMADIRFFVSNGIKDKIIDKEKSHRNFIITNGFDLDDAFPFGNESFTEVNERKLRFIYTGALYGGKRNIRPFFQALVNIFARTDIRASQLSLEYAGNEGSNFCKQAAEFGLEERVVDHGRLSRAGALKLQQQADVCLLATWNSEQEQGVLTGKIFEYFMAKKPIISIVDGNLGGSEIAQVMNRIGAGFCYESSNANSMSNLEQWIINAFHMKSSVGILPSEYNKFVNDFNFKSIALDVKIILNSFLQEKGCV